MLWRAENLHGIETKIFDLMSILFQEKMIFNEPKVLWNGLKFETRMNIKKKSELDFH